MVYRTVFMVMSVFAVLILSGCFRDAGDSDVAPTQREVRLSDVQAQQTNAAPTRTLTLVSTATGEPIPLQLSPTSDKTLVIGGPPVEDDSDSTGDVAVADEPTVEPSEPPATATVITNTPSPTQPSATPTITTVPPDVATVAPPGFGDTGISPTPSQTFTPTLEILATPTEIAPQQNECEYLVEGGDTIFGIAREFDLTPEDFYAVNPQLAINPDDLQVGQILRIPNCVTEAEANDASTQSSVISASTTPVFSDGTIVHIVESGDTLSTIAQEYGVSVDDIIAANDDLISVETTIFVGQELIISR